MAFTTNKLYSVQTAGSNAGTWGAGAATALNEGVIEIIDANMGGVTSLTLTNVNVNLTQAQANNAMLRLTGTLTGNVIIVPNVGVTMTGFVYFENLTTGSFSVIFGNSSATVTLPSSRRGVVFIDPTNGARIVSIVGSSAAAIVPAGTNMTFYQASVPTGWTAVSTGDRIARLVDNGSGGVSGGSVTFTILFGRITTDNHALTTAEIPSHTHASTYSGDGRSSGASVTVGSIAQSGLGSSWSTQATGGGGTHNHGMDMRVQYLSLVVGALS